MRGAMKATKTYDGRASTNDYCKSVTRVGFVWLINVFRV